MILVFYSHIFIDVLISYCYISLIEYLQNTKLFLDLNIIKTI